MLDDGRLTDGQGRTVDFRNTVLVMTSNLGSQEILKLGNQNQFDVIEEAVINEVEQHFRPEFINRIDELIVFDTLSQSDIKEIAGLFLVDLNVRLKDKDLSLEIQPDALTKLVDRGYDPVYGARPLKRTFQKMVEDPLANLLIEGNIESGTKLSARLSEGRVVVE